MSNEIESFCDFSIRVKRGGVWDVYLLERTVDWETQAWPHEKGTFSEESHITVAMNLPENGEKLEQVQLLLTPDVLASQWSTSRQQMLATWNR